MMYHMLFTFMTVVAFVVTFLLNPVSKKISGMITGKRHARFHIHHSVTGLLIFAAGVIVTNPVISGIGMGIYLGHVAEEIYFNKTGFVKAFFVLVTR